MMQSNLTHLKTWMQEKKIDLVYLTNPQTIQYFTNFSGDPHERVMGLFISLHAQPFLFVPALDVEAAQQSNWSYPIIGYLDQENPWQLIADNLKQTMQSYQQIALEKGSLNVQNFENFKQFFPNAEFNYDVTPIIQQMQLHKSKEEYQRLLDAGNWADFAFEIGFKALRNGASEQEIAAEINYQLARKGVTQLAFPTTVLSGANAAKPHGVPGNTAINPHEMILFDLGVIYNGYCSDATRTVAFREPTKEQAAIHQIVLDAQLAAQTAAKPGITAGTLDKIARDVITEAGYGQFFNHRLGHGIGTSVHEFPSLVAGNDLIIEEGMCFSIEPGIYLPNHLGVRIEDCVYVTKNGALPLTQTSKKLLVFE